MSSEDSEAFIGADFNTTLKRLSTWRRTMASTGRLCSPYMLKPRDQYRRPIDWALAKAESMGMNQSGFAKAMHVTPAVVSGWKQRGGMPAEYYERTADVLRCSIDELVGRAAPRAPPAEWPFPGISYSRIQPLEEADRMRVEAAMAQELTAQERARREKNVRQLGRPKPDAQPHRHRKNPS
jgi:hypothetical protein